MRQRPLQSGAVAGALDKRVLEEHALHSRRLRHSGMYSEWQVIRSNHEPKRYYVRELLGFRAMPQRRYAKVHICVYARSEREHRPDVHSSSRWRQNRDLHRRVEGVIGRPAAAQAACEPLDLAGRGPQG